MSTTVYRILLVDPVPRKPITLIDADSPEEALRIFCHDEELTILKMFNYRTGSHDSPDTARVQHPRGFTEVFHATKD